MSYYDRKSVLAADGTPVFKTEEDEKNESEVAAILEAAWNCKMSSFGRLSPVDWYATRDGRVIGLVEVKSRTHASTTYSTVFLNLRKWLAMTLAQTGTGVPAIFVARFTDTIKFIRVDAVDASKLSLRGCREIVKSRNDIEPVIEVPVASMVGLT